MFFAAKCYWPGVDEAEFETIAARAAANSSRDAVDGVRYLGSLLFGDDKLVLCMFEAPSPLAVKRASERAGIPCERVMGSVWLEPRSDTENDQQQKQTFCREENNWQQYRDFVFGPLRARHDLVFIDQRGAGRSHAIDCPSLQNGVNGDVFAAYGACASFLGPAANDYGSGDVALDIDAVRAALGIDRFEFYGGSYAAVDIQAYAARFGEHLTAVVLDSPGRIVGFDDFFRSGPPAIIRAVTLVCRRSVSCSAEHLAAGDELGWLARRLRAHPLVGTGIDSTGKRHHLRVTESFLAWRIMQNTGGPFVVDAEIAAAAKALRAGDEVPLLRLAADSDGPLIGPFTGDTSGAPSEFSGGDNAARQCTDLTLPWQKDAPVPVRHQRFDAARMALASDSFAPFSIDAWLAPAPTGPIGPDLCLTWPAGSPAARPCRSSRALSPPGSQSPIRSPRSGNSR